MLIEILDQLFPLGIAFVFGALATEIVKFARRWTKAYDRDNDEY